MADDYVDSTVIPDWVPELRAGVRADVYPVSPPQPGPCPAELVLDRESVTAGYAEHRPPYEFGSLLGSDVVSTDSLTKVRHALAGLRKARPSALQRVELMPPFAPPADSAMRKPTFPMQKPSAKSSSLEDWFNKLASGGAFSTSTLSKAVPLGPAIVRAVGTVLEMMAVRGVPTQRAVWYIRIAVLNECVKQIRPDRPAPSPRQFWTRQLASLLKVELDQMRTKKKPPHREFFWHYVLDLARWQSDEGLLEHPVWLERIVASIRQDLASGKALGVSAGGRIALRAAETFAPEFAVSPTAGRHLVDALVSAVEAVGGAAAASAQAAVSTPTAAPAGTATATAGSQADPSGSATVRVAPSVTTSSRQAPATRIEALLRKIVPVALGLSPSKQLPRDLAGLVALVRAAPPAGASPSSEQKRQTLEPKGVGASSGPQAVSRALERLTSSGDVGGVADLVRSCFDGGFYGGLRAAISFLCAWAVRGPMRSSSLAVPIAATMISTLSKGMYPSGRSGGTSGASRRENGRKAVSGNVTPVFQSEVWMYVKNLGDLRRSQKPLKAQSGVEGGATGHDGGLGSNSEETAASQQDQFGFFVDPAGSDEEDLRMVRLLAQLYRVGEFSLGAYFREVARLVSSSHASARRHLLYVAALPEPTDRSAADTRRSLLRRGQRVVGRVTSSCEADDAVISAVVACDVAQSVEHGRRIRKESSEGTVLATAEGVLDLDHCEVKSSEQRVLSVVGFLSAAGVESLAVEWLARVMSLEAFDFDSETSSQARQPCKSSEELQATKYDALLDDAGAVCAMVYALDNLAPSVAATGNLNLILERLVGLHVMYEGKAKTASSNSSSVLTAIECTAMSYAATFAPNGGSGNSRWTVSVARLAGDPSAPKKLVGFLLFGRAAADKELSSATLAMLRGDVKPVATVGDSLGDGVASRCESTPGMGKAEMEAYWGPTPDEDLDRMASLTETSEGLKSLAEFVSSRGSQEEDTAPPSIGPWATSNSVIGGVVVPEIKKALMDRGQVEHINNVISSSLELLKDGLYEHDLCGARPNLVLELIATLGAASLLTVFPSANEHLAGLLGRPWVKQALLSRAGTGMVNRLRSRLDAFVGKDSDPVLISTLVRDSVVALYSGPLLVGESPVIDEALVVQLLCWTELGVSESFLAAFAGLKCASSQIEEFGSLVGKAAASILYPEQAEALVDCVVQCTNDEDCGRVAGALGLASVEALAECLAALVAHVLMDNTPGGSAVPQSERETWAAFDSTRCAMMNAVAPFLEAPGSIVPPVLKQLTAASEQLQRPGVGTLQPDMSSNGIIFSSAVESRFQLLEFLTKREVWKRENAGDVVDVAQTASEVDTVVTVAGVMAAAAPLLLPSAMSAGLKAVGAALEAADLSGQKFVEVSVAENDDGVSEGEKSVLKVPLRTKLSEILRPVGVWLDDPQKSIMHLLFTTSSRASLGAPGVRAAIRQPVVALKADGTELDSWYLLEGYGRGSEEEAAIAPHAFGIQGMRPVQKKVSSSSAASGNVADSRPPGTGDMTVSRLKRTYSTYACMAVR